MNQETEKFEGSGSAEMVAYRLLHVIADISSLKLHLDPNHASKDWILDTYSECLKATKGQRK